MSYSFGLASQARMIRLHPDFVRVLNLAISISNIDFMIAEGLRSDEQCYINFGKGRTVIECTNAGCPAKYAQPFESKVTWLAHPLSSNHRMKPDGFGHAVDLYPYPVSLILKPASVYEPLFNRIAAAMFNASKELKIPIRWGADWNMNNLPRERGETDNPHFELRS